MSLFETAQDQFVTVDGIRFAYRWFGRPHDVPLVLLMHFRGTMDHWDPALLDPIAIKRPVILIDNSGVGRSGGEIPKTFKMWAKHYIDVVLALGVKQADIAGFSMGGCVAQLVALNAPNLVRKLILLGTIPSTGAGVTRADIGPFNRLRVAATEEEQLEAFLATFFADTENSQSAGRDAWSRIASARKDRTDFVPAEGAYRQAVAFAKFMDPKQAKDASYDRFNELRLPVLIVNGSNDLLLPTENSIVMWKKLSHAQAQLHLFPDSGHGFLFQYASELSKLINDFLDGPGQQHSKL